MTLGYSSHAGQIRTPNQVRFLVGLNLVPHQPHFGQNISSPMRSTASCFRCRRRARWRRSCSMVLPTIVQDQLLALARTQVPVQSVDLIVGGASVTPATHLGLEVV